MTPTQLQRLRVIADWQDWNKVFSNPKGRSNRIVEAVDLELVLAGLVRFETGRWGSLNLTEPGRKALALTGGK